MVWVVGIISALNLLCISAQLSLVQVGLLNEAGLLHEVVEEQGQRGPLGGLSKTKNVKLPVVLCILHRPIAFKELTQVRASKSHMHP